MKTLNRTLSALALTTMLAGAAIAGPSNPTVAFGTPVASKATRGCPMIKAETKLTALATPKGPIAIQKVTGYRHRGCYVAADGKVACKPTSAACATMSRG